MNNGFDHLAWQRRCEVIAHQANSGCGLVYENYERSFCQNVNHALSQIDMAHRERAVQIATRYGYVSAAQRVASEALLRLSGSCSHGIDPYHCPVGCGDIDTGAED